MKASRITIVVVALAAACAEAGGDTKGGDLTDAGKQAVTPGEFTAVFDAGTQCGEGTTWSSLYRDIFGVEGKPGSCRFASNCHGSPEAAGATSGAGIKCFDEKTCRASMIEKGLVSPSNAKNPARAVLFTTIRNRDPVDGATRGFMPKSPGDYFFPEACLDRMKGWIANGVPED